MATTEPLSAEEAEEDAERARTTAEQIALLLFAVAAYEALTPDTLTDMDALRLEKITGGLIESTARQIGYVLPTQTARALTVNTARELHEFVFLLRRRAFDQELSGKRSPAELSPQREAARQLAARAHAAALATVAGHVVDTGTFGKIVLKKVWITRADDRVRPLHARLHGRIKRWDEDFWRWPGTGQRLRFPGDPDAPLDAVINCRCLCFLSWSSKPVIKVPISPPTEVPA